MWTSHVTLVREVHLHTSTIVFWFNKLIFEMLGNNLHYGVLCIFICSYKPL